MQLLVHITSKPEVVPPLMTALMEKGIHGATVVDCKGMLTTINENNIDPPPIFGSLRQFINPDRESGKMIFIVMRDEDVPAAKDVIHDISGDLKQSGNGILFTLPIMGWEGVPHK